MFQQMLDKGRELIAPMRSKMTLTELVNVISKIPLVGKPTVKALASRSSQRHKCDRCGTVFEVTVSRIMECPFAVLADSGRERLAELELTVLRRQAAAAPTLAGVVSTTNEAQHVVAEVPSIDRPVDVAAKPLEAPAADTAERQCIRAAVDVLPHEGGAPPQDHSDSSATREGVAPSQTANGECVDGSANSVVADSPTVPIAGEPDGTATSETSSPNGFTERPSDDAPRVATEPAPEPSTAVSAASSMSAPAVDPASPIAASTKDRFPCPSCGGRLGVNCFPGDATNGDKQVLLDRLLALFRVMPEVLAVQMRPETVHAIKVSDVYWVD